MQDEQTKQLARVSRNIADVIKEFFDSRTGEFTAAEIEAFVTTRCRANASSVTRVMRDLRARDEISFRVVNRSRSLYEITKTIRQRTLF